MNKGRFYALGEEGELREICELKGVDTFCPAAFDEQLEKLKEAWRHFGEQVMLNHDNWRVFVDMLYNIEPKYIRTERKFPKKKKRGTMRRRRRERRANETNNIRLLDGRSNTVEARI